MIKFNKHDKKTKEKEKSKTKKKILIKKRDKTEKVATTDSKPKKERKPFLKKPGGEHKKLNFQKKKDNGESAILKNAKRSEKRIIRKNRKKNKDGKIKLSFKNRNRKKLPKLPKLLKLSKLPKLPKLPVPKQLSRIQNKILTKLGKNTLGGRNQNLSKRKVLGIQSKIFICFLVPIAFMIVLGITSYQRAADGMSDLFKESTQQTINMASEYIDVSNSFIEAEALKYVIDADLGNYFLGKYQDDAVQKRTIMEGKRSELVASQVANNFINNIYLIPDGEVQMITTMRKNQPGNYQEYMEEMLALSEDGKNIPKWVDKHEALDTYLEMDASEYIMVCQMTAKKGKAAIVVDVKTEALQEFLDTLDLGTGSIIGFVTPNGREIISQKDEKGESIAVEEGTQIFADKEFYQKMGEQEGCSEVKYNGVKYLFFHTTSEDTDASVCALVPMEVVTGKAETIKKLSAIGVIVASIIAVAIGVWIADGIKKNMKLISGGLKEVASGNLTTQVSVKGRDEFLGFAAAANDMIANNKKLVLKVRQATNTLEDSASEVAEVSGVINEYSMNIAQAINEINDGMEKQSVHAQECVRKTNTLSTEIQEVNKAAQNVEALAGSAEEMIARGMEFVQILDQRAEGRPLP